MSWQRVVEDTVTGLGYELVDAEKSVGGLLRVYIDHPAIALNANSIAEGAAAPAEFITVDDCEKVTRQLQHVLEVEAVAYERLEVSSPGLDRPLKKPADFARFVGEQVALTLKVPLQGRKKYDGELSANGDGWRLLLADGKPVGADAKRTAARTSARQAAAPSVASDAPATERVLDFSLDEVREARLVPVFDFKGRPSKGSEDVVSPAGTGPHIGIDGGRLQ